MFGVFWVPLGSPRGVPELCWLSWAALGCSELLLVAALGCCWLLLVAPSPPTREPQRATQP